MKYLLLILMSLFLASCTSSYYKAPMLASTKAASLPAYKALGKVEFKGCNNSVYFGLFPIAFVDFKSLYNKVLQDAIGMGGDAVVDFQVRQTSMTNFLFLYMSSCYSVTGVAVRFTSGASAWDVSPDEASSVWDASPDEASSVWDASPEAVEENKPKSSWD